MRVSSRALGDLLLAVLAVVVLCAAAMVMTGNNAPVPSALAVSSTPTPSASATTAPPSATPSPSADPISSAAGGTVVLAGPDLAKLKDSLAALTDYTVEVVEGADAEVLAPNALDAITSAPSAVVLEVLAGSRTTLRTAAAITAVKAKWPGVLILVIGPFSSEDRLSAAAVASAALAADVTFLDPVKLKWRTSDTAPTLAAADLPAVTAKLAQALS